MTNREFLHQIHALTRELVHSAPSRALRPQPHSRLGGAFASRSLQMELYKVSLPSLVLSTSSVISTTKNKTKNIIIQAFHKILRAQSTTLNMNNTIHATQTKKQTINHSCTINKP